MESEIEFVPSGTVSSPAGFYAGATSAGIKKGDSGALDLGILFSEVPCAAAAVFTTNRIKAAPVVLSRRRLRSGRAQAVVINSGCANACTGQPGRRDAIRVSSLVAEGLGVPPEAVLVSSTGIIGKPLPMERLEGSLNRVVLSRDGGHELAKAILTTDTVPKEAAVAVKAGQASFTVGGIVKGSGMIHPNMGTLLCFITTDAAVEVDFLRTALRQAVDASFNMVSIDGDTSPNDTVLVMANGLAGNSLITRDSELADVFQRALDMVCRFLARRVAADGEGANRLIEVTVNGAVNIAQAKRAARAVVSSTLVKAAVHGGDPNWGRIVAAVGRSGARVVESKIDLSIGDSGVLKGGRPLPSDSRELRRILSSDEVTITLGLNQGSATATAWGCDLSEEYVTINSEYTT